MVLPLRSVIVTEVLLNVEKMWAIPTIMFLLPFALTILGFSTSLGSSERFSTFGAFRPRAWEQLPSCP